MIAKMRGGVVRTLCRSWVCDFTQWQEQVNRERTLRLHALACCSVKVTMVARLAEMTHGLKTTLGDAIAKEDTSCTR